MSRPVLVFPQRDFSAGEIDAAARRGDDNKVMRAGLAKARNVRIRSTRTLTRRPGRSLLYHLSASEAREFTVQPKGGKRHTFVFTNGQAAVYENGVTAPLQTFGSMPWSSSQVADLAFDFTGEKLVVVHQALRPRVFTYDAGTNAWSQAAWSYATGLQGVASQAFWRFAAPGITMQPAGTGGSFGGGIGTTTITFSAPVLNAGHVGTEFRYSGKRLRIDAVTSSTTANVTVLQALPPTIRVKMTAVDGYYIGDVVQGERSGAKGEVVGIISGPPHYLEVLMDRDYQGFGTDEIVIGPTGNAKSDAPGPINTIIAPAATRRWDEQFLSDHRGWPGSVAYDRQRLIFADFPQLKNGILWSAVGAIDDFEVGADGADAIFETAPSGSRVLYVQGGADQFVFQEDGVSYIPISEANPLKPGSVAFRLIGSTGTAKIRPAAVREGLVYVNEQKSRIMAVVGTGQTARPYILRDTTEWHSTLIKKPVALASTSGAEDTAEQYVYVVNNDGTVVVGRYQDGEDWVGWVLWESREAVKNVQTLLETVYFRAQRSGALFVEKQDDKSRLDASVVLASSTGTSALLVPFAGLSVHLLESTNKKRGSYTVTGGGGLSGAPAGLADVRVGFDFDAEVSCYLPNVGEERSVGQRITRRRVVACGAFVEHDYGFQLGPTTIADYAAGESQAGPPSTKKTVYRPRRLGRDYDPGYTLVQQGPGRLDILELMPEVTV